jgi:hypothetical protein
MNGERIRCFLKTYLVLGFKGNVLSSSGIYTSPEKKLFAKENYTTPWKMS